MVLNRINDLKEIRWPYQKFLTISIYLSIQNTLFVRIWCYGLFKYTVIKTKPGICC